MKLNIHKSLSGNKNKGKNRFFYISLMRLILLIVVIMLIVSLLLVGFSNMDAYTRSLKRQAKTYEQMVSSIIKNLGKETIYFAANPSIVNLVVAGNPENTESPEAIEAVHLLDKAADLRPDFVGISVEDKEGRFYLNGAGLSKMDEITRQNDREIPHDVSQNPYTVSFWNKGNDVLVEISAPIKGVDESRIGTVHAYYDNNIITLPDNGQGWSTVLFSSNTWMPVLWQSNDGIDAVNQEIMSSRGLMEGLLATEKADKPFFYKNAGGEQMLGFVISDSEYPIALLCSITANTMYRTVITYSSYHLVITLMLFALFSGLLYFIYRRMEKPILELTKRSRKITDGDQNVDFGQYDEGILNLLAESLNQYREKIEKTAYEDYIFKIGNNMKANRDISAFIQKKTPFTLFLLDISNFGKYNRIFSVRTGNQILKSVSQGLEQIFGEHTYHIRGDLFLGLTTMIGTDEALLLSIRKLMDSEIHIEGISFFIKYKMGICHYPKDGENMVALMAALESAMGVAKHYMEEPVVVYNRAVENYQNRESKILSLVEKCIEEKEFDVWFQPVYDYCQNEFTSVEALLRLKNEKDKYYPPFEVVHVAQKYNMAGTVGTLVLKKACQTIKQLEEKGIFTTVAVNLSVQEILDQDYDKKALAVIRKEGISPEKISMEITESLLLESFPAAIDTLNQLATAGVKIVMDDFGAVSGNLSYFSKIPFDGIKLSSWIVKWVQKGSEEFEFFKAFIRLMQARGIKVVAERVETEDDFKSMTLCGANLIQGYYFSKPLQESDLIAFLEKANKNK